MPHLSAEDLANRFLSSIERGDLASAMDCITPDAVLWHNGTRKSVSRDENLEVLRGFVARSVTREYHDRRVQEFPGGFILQHNLVATAADGYVLEASACLVCRTTNGRITWLEEYFDWSDLPEWFARTQPQLEAAGLAWPSAWSSDAESRPTGGEIRSN
ncbi:hypothetical protein NT2_01_05770 [Caenibius tardaugens NBRC 16725]|uniref:SnoaL-like domain-containing protein n=1 Tax=Caenibius tardaugens NBRC 16725 TaxID=1219035 RepID=U2ZZ71_9SPHN|nr:hypothetical protein [Caenibius tardaugens]AZI36979.1 hypothetical protein EGO55_14260 [Caenibius tardaugens NBRC 16725]GAD47803.1 hypothetical protein NT2_01_05770 [Caenibius tardaugens NBRC 16725]